jgi:hypothetical protein
MIVLPLFISPALAQVQLPVITNAQADVPNRHLLINGSAFGSLRPVVNLAGTQLTVSSFTDRQIVAVLPDGLNGDYLLTVTNSSSHLFGIFVVTIGATGPAGPQGPKGDTGATGATGPQGPPVNLIAGSNITITPTGNALTISATGGSGIPAVAHDATLQGDGTPATPLAVAVPLPFSGSIPSDALLVVQNTANGGQGVRGIGGDDIGSGGTGFAGTGVGGRGGLSDSGPGGFGVLGTGGDSTSNTGGTGVRGRGGLSDSGFGGVGVRAIGGDSASGSGGIGVIASGGSGPLGIGLAARFLGEVQVTGNLSKGGGSFKIDHPLDPENKYLYHSFVESPDMMNIYNGNVVTDANGDAVVEMPDYFEALNKAFRYQLTVIGTFAQAIVAEEISGNRFKIRTSAPNVKVSWQVTGIRHDAWANKNRIKVEVVKDERERGFYLHPEVFNQPEERGIEWVHNPEMMKQRKQQREEFERTRTNQTAKQTGR